MINGQDLERHRLSLPTYRGGPRVVLTTESSTERQLEGKAAGATGWLVQPFNPERLLSTIARVLS